MNKVTVEMVRAYRLTVETNGCSETKDYSDWSDAALRAKARAADLGVEPEVCEPHEDDVP